MKKKVALVAGIILLVIAVIDTGSHYPTHGAMMRAYLRGSIAVALALLLIWYAKRNARRV